MAGHDAITRDGCAVAVYRRLPTGDDAALVHRVAPSGAAILDLGAGVGRIADPLVRLGHRVVAVDDSAEMLSQVANAATVQSSIESLRLPDRFDVVLLASHLINTDDQAVRMRLLETVAYHLRPDGVALIQWHPPSWFDSLQAGQTLEGHLGQVAVRLEVHAMTCAMLTASVSYTVDEKTWLQDFTAQRLDEDDVGRDLQQAGLHVANDLALGPDWLSVRHETGLDPTVRHEPLLLRAIDDGGSPWRLG